MDVFSYSSYKIFVLDRIQAMPKGGHGQFVKMARHMGVSPVIVTQVLKGDRQFSDEQALRLTDFLGLPSIETEYFMHLVAAEKAGSSDLKTFHLNAMMLIKKRTQEVKHRVAEYRELGDAEKSVFYSDWTYSAVRLLTSLKDHQTADALAERLGLRLTRVNEILEFLLQVGLCKRNSSGDLELGTASTHLEAQSRFVNNHRRNWRLKGLEGINRATEDDLFYSAPCTISRTHFEGLKGELLEAIASLTRRAPEGNAEVLACLNIDWFFLLKN